MTITSCKRVYIPDYNGDEDLQWAKWRALENAINREAKDRQSDPVPESCTDQPDNS